MDEAKRQALEKAGWRVGTVDDFLADIMRVTYSNSSLVRLTHIPTGVSADCGDSPSMFKNERSARAELKRKLEQQMPMFAVHMKQGGGCDYTIACGQKLVPFPSSVQTLEEAVKKLVTGEGNPYNLSYYGDDVEEAVVYEVTRSTTVDIKSLNAHRAEQQAKEDAEEEERLERERFEQLKRKYGG